MNHINESLDKTSFTVKYNQRKKTKKITVRVRSVNELEVTYPFGVSKSRVDKFIQSRLEAIQESFSLKRNHFYQTLEDNNYCLHTLKGDIFFHYDGPEGMTGAVTQKNGLHIYYSEKSDLSNPDFIRQSKEVIIKKLKRDARIVLAERLDYLAHSFGYSYNRISYRNQQTRWGSCSAENNISLNIKLMLLSTDLVDYVLLHELVHTRIKNHSSLFWKKLGEHMPDCKLRRKELRQKNLSWLDV